MGYKMKGFSGFGNNKKSPAKQYTTGNLDATTADSIRKRLANLEAAELAAKKDQKSATQRRDALDEETAQRSEKRAKKHRETGAKQQMLKKAVKQGLEDRRESYKGYRTTRERVKNPDFIPGVSALDTEYIEKETKHYATESPRFTEGTAPLDPNLDQYKSAAEIKHDAKMRKVKDKATIKAQKEKLKEEAKATGKKNIFGGGMTWKEKRDIWKSQSKLKKDLKRTRQAEKLQDKYQRQSGRGTIGLRFNPMDVLIGGDIASGFTADRAADMTVEKLTKMQKQRELQADKKYHRDKAEKEADKIRGKE